MLLVFILQNPVHLVSALRLGDILILGEKRRKSREGEERTGRETDGREKRREKKLSSAVVALSEDAALHISALFCPEPQSKENNTEDSYCTDLKIINGHLRGL